MVQQSAKDCINKYEIKYKITPDEKLYLLTKLKKLQSKQTYIGKKDLENALIKFRSLDPKTVKLPTDKQEIEDLNNTILEISSEDEEPEQTDNLNPENTKNTKIETKMSDTVNLVLKIFSPYNSDPVLLPTVIDQLDLIELSIKAADHAHAIAAIKSRLSGKARDALDSTTNTIALIKSKLKSICSGEPSWHVATAISGIKFSEKESYVKSLTDATLKLKLAFINEGTSSATAEKYATNEVVNNIKKNFQTNNFMVNAMNQNFNNVEEVIQRFRQVQNDKEAIVMAMNFQKKPSYDNYRHKNFKKSNNYNDRKNSHSSKHFYKNKNKNYSNNYKVRHVQTKTDEENSESEPPSDHSDQEN